MADRTSRDLGAEARAALTRLREYAATHSDDVAAAIDKVGEYVDAQTKGRYSGRITRARSAAQAGVRATLRGKKRTPRPDPTDVFADDAPTWRQPPSFDGRRRGADAPDDAEHDRQSASSGHAQGPSAADAAAALAALRAYAAAHADELGGWIDKLGGYVDRQTQGRHSERIGRAQAGAKRGIDKLKR